MHLLCHLAQHIAVRLGSLHLFFLLFNRIDHFLALTLSCLLHSINYVCWNHFLRKLDHVPSLTSLLNLSLHNISVDLHLTYLVMAHRSFNDFRLVILRLVFCQSLGHEANKIVSLLPQFCLLNLAFALILQFLKEFTKAEVNLALHH